MLSIHDLVLKPDKSFVCVWCLPVASKPVVKVEGKGGYVRAETLFKIACDVLDLHENSRPYFGLFKGIVSPTKKYGSDEIIRLPCKTTTSLQKWSFDLKAEMSRVRMDPVALKLLAHQVKSDIELDKFRPDAETLEKLQEDEEDESFLTYRRYVEIARQAVGYDSTTFRNVTVFTSIKIMKTIIKKGTKIDLECTPKSLILNLENHDLTIPWRKVRRMTDLKQENCVGFEIYLVVSQTFVWLELQTVQACLLLQTTGEILTLFKKQIQRPVFKQPNWHQPEDQSLWVSFKTEVLTFKKKKKPPPKMQDFDNLKDIPSDDEEDSGDERKRQRLPSITSTSSNKKGYSYVSDENLQRKSYQVERHSKVVDRRKANDANRISAKLTLNDAATKTHTQIISNDSLTSLQDEGSKTEVKTSAIVHIAEKNTENHDKNDRVGTKHIEEKEYIEEETDPEYIESKSISPEASYASSCGNTSNKNSIDETDFVDEESHGTDPYRSPSELEDRRKRKKKKCDIRLQTIHAFLKPADVEKLQPTLKLGWTSSDSEVEEDEETLVVSHPISWRSERFTRALRKIDKITDLEMTNSSKNLRQKNMVGSPSVKRAPRNISHELLWIIKKELIAT